MSTQPLGKMLPPMAIERRRITIGDIEIPGEWIERRGVDVEPIDDAIDVNRVTVTFLAGPVDIGDDARSEVRVGPPPLLDLRPFVREVINEYRQETR